MLSTSKEEEELNSPRKRSESRGGLLNEKEPRVARTGICLLQLSHRKNTSGSGSRLAAVLLVESPPRRNSERAAFLKEAMRESMLASFATNHTLATPTVRS